MSEIKCIRQQADARQIHRCIDDLSQRAGQFDYLSNAVSVIGNKVRLKILYLLGVESRLCVCDLSDILGMTIPAVSQHLKKLRCGNLITSHKEAQTVFYSLSEEYSWLLSPLFQSIGENAITS